MAARLVLDHDCTASSGNFHLIVNRSGSQGQFPRNVRKALKRRAKIAGEPFIPRSGGATAAKTRPRRGGFTAACSMFVLYPGAHPGRSRSPAASDQAAYK